MHLIFLFVFYSKVQASMADSYLKEQNSNNKILDGGKKVLNKETNNQTADWKQTLSGALTDGHLLGALVVLAIFYIGYAIVSGYHDNHSKDEDHVTLRCSCHYGHRKFYIAWYSTCCVLWLFVHLCMKVYYGALWKRLKPCFLKHVSNKVKRGEHSNTVVCCSPNHYCWCYPCAYVGNKLSMLLRYLTEKSHKEVFRFQHYIFAQYYELYVIGITKNIQNMNFEYFHQIIMSANQKNIRHSEQTTTDSPYQQQEPNKKLKSPNVITAVSNRYDKRSWMYILHYCFHIFLWVVQFFSQLSVVPLLLIQMFDTYAFLCFTGDSYCSLRAEYKLHLDQTALTFAFYCSLTLSFLSSVMLTWIPGPNLDNKESSSSSTTSEYTATQSGIPVFPTIVTSRLTLAT